MPFPGFSASLFPSHSGVIIPRLVLVQLGSEANGLLSATQQALVYLDLLESGIGTAALQALYKPAAEQDRAAVSGIFNAIRREYAKVGIAYAALVCGLSVLFPFFFIKTELPFFTVLLTVLLGGMGQTVRFLLQAKYRVLLQAEGQRIRAHQRQLAFNCFHQHRQNHTANLRIFAHRRTAALLFVRLTANRTAHTLRQKTV